MVYLYIAIALVVGYFLGSINFAIIFSWNLGKKDITKEGSKNPGTMNMLRTQGFGRAMLTLACEALKVGLPALACFFIFEHFPEFSGFGNLAYFASAFGGIIGHCYPVFYKFKGGKGVACTFGMFLFHPVFWWLALVMFALCFALFFFIKYGFIIFIITMTVYATSYFAIEQVMWWLPVIVMLWLIVALIVFKHRSNISRLVSGTENQVNFKEQVFSKTKKNVEKPSTQNNFENLNQMSSATNFETAQENVKENEEK